MEVSNTKKNIFIVSMTAELGGIEKSLINFLTFLTSFPNIHIDLMLWKCKGELLNEIPDSVQFLQSPAPGNLKQVLASGRIKLLYDYISLKWFTRKHTPWISFAKYPKRYDIAISFSQDGYSPYYVIDKIDADKKYLWYHHGSYEENKFKKNLDRKYYSLFHNIIAVSVSIRDILIKNFPFLNNKIKVINNIIDDEKILKLSEVGCEDCQFNPDSYTLITVGRLSDEKGQLRALNVAKELKRKGLKFIWLFIGDGPDYKKCIDKVNELQLNDCCKFMGSRSNPYPYIRKADIVISPSFIEADPITIQESIILDKQILASNIPSINYALKDYPNGEVIDFTQSELVANKIMTIFSTVNRIKFNNHYDRNNIIHTELKKLLNL